MARRLWLSARARQSTARRKEQKSGSTMVRRLWLSKKARQSAVRRRERRVGFAGVLC
jgi:hypothetical protein